MRLIYCANGINCSYFLIFSLHSLAMRLKIEKIRIRSPTRLATIV
jgi:hypothetical protein